MTELETTSKMKIKIVMDLMCNNANIALISAKYQVPVYILIRWKREFMLDINHQFKVSE